MTTVPTSDTTRPRLQPGGGATFVYWVLVLMGVAVFAPCVLYPEWRHYQQLRAVEQAERRRVEALREKMERDRLALDAMRSDPAVIARLAQRELRYKKADERTIRVDVDEAVDLPFADPAMAHTEATPSWAGFVSQRLPDVDYDHFLLDRGTTTALMTLSVALIAVAVGFVARRPA